eukprot:359446-Chlamydomonas_euryale.AAC.10
MGALEAALGRSGAVRPAGGSSRGGPAGAGRAAGSSCEDTRLEASRAKVDGGSGDGGGGPGGGVSAASGATPRHQAATGSAVGAAPVAAGRCDNHAAVVLSVAAASRASRRRQHDVWAWLLRRGVGHLGGGIRSTAGAPLMTGALPATCSACAEDMRAAWL